MARSRAWLSRELLRDLTVAAAIGAIAMGPLPQIYAEPQFSSVPVPTPRLKFDVASIRRAPDLLSALRSGKTPHTGTKIDGNRVDIGYVALLTLILDAFELRPGQIVGPDWLSAGHDTPRFDILAKMPDGATNEQLPEMLQALLIERFKLVTHRESKEQPVYALVVGRGGPKLKSSAGTEPSSPVRDESRIKGKLGEDAELRTESQRTTPSGGTRKLVTEGGVAHWEFKKMTTKELASFLTGALGRPVLDMTELKGAYDLSLDDIQDNSFKTPVDAGNSPPISPAPPGSSIVAGLEKLGLKLDSRRAPIEQLVIDHLEMEPTDN